MLASAGIGLRNGGRMAVPGTTIGAPAARRAATLPVLLCIAALGGCGLAAGQGGLSNSTVGDVNRGGQVQQYAFARARVPITLEGTVEKQRRGYALKVAASVGAPKYALDGSLSVRIATKETDRFKATISNRHMLASLVTVNTRGEVLEASAGDKGIADFTAAVMAAVPLPTATGVLERTSPVALKPFRLDTEVDPALPEETAAFARELARVAPEWGLQPAFEAVPTDAAVAGRRLALAPSQAKSCSQPVCFRLPIPYRLSVGTTTTGWRGRIETHVWLPNEGPIAALDVRNAAFAAAGVRATFENGMLRSLTSRQAGTAEALLLLPSAPATTSSVQR